MKTVSKIPKIRTNLLESKIDAVFIIVKELLNGIYSKDMIRIASYNIYPQAFFVDKITDKIVEKIKSFIRFPAMPSQVLLNIRTYHQALLHIDPGIDISNIFKEVG